MSCREDEGPDAAAESGGDPGLRQNAIREARALDFVVRRAGGEVRPLDPRKARRRREVRLGENAAIENLLAWVDPPV